MIKLRESKESELRTFAEMEHQPHAKKFINVTKLEKHLKDFFDENIIYLTIENENSELAGYFILAFEESRKKVEFRRVLVDQNNRGIGQQSIVEMEKYCCNVLRTKNIWLDVYADNLKGKHIYEKLGYQYFREDNCDGRRLLYYQKYL